MSEPLTRVTKMRLFHIEDIGQYYVRTLRAWRDNLYKSKAQIQELGYSHEFFRMWEFYFCYCEGGFTERVISDVQMMLTKPKNRREPISCIQAA